MGTTVAAAFSTETDIQERHEYTRITLFNDDDKEEEDGTSTVFSSQQTMMRMSTSSSSSEHRAGRILYHSCQSCHVGHPIAPQFWRNQDCLLGQTAGTMYEGYRYSSALQNSRIVWEEDTLDAFLEDPQKFIPGNVMENPPMTDPIERKVIIEILKSYCIEEEADDKFSQENNTINGTEQSVPETEAPTFLPPVWDYASDSSGKDVSILPSLVPWMTTSVLLSMWFLFGPTGRR